MNFNEQWTTRTKSGSARRGALVMALVAGALLAQGCATTAEDRFLVDYNRHTFQSEFVAFRDTCWRAGRRVVVDSRRGLDRDELPLPGDRYYCQ